MGTRSPLWCRPYPSGTTEALLFSIFLPPSLDCSHLALFFPCACWLLLHNSLGLGVEREGKRLENALITDHSMKRAGFEGNVKDAFCAWIVGFYHSYILNYFFCTMQLLTESMCVSEAWIAREELSCSEGWSIGSNWHIICCYILYVVYIVSKPGILPPLLLPNMCTELIHCVVTKQGFN